MQNFWTWAVRNPAIVFGAAMCAGGATGVLDWGLALTGFAVGAAFANFAHRRVEAARDRQERKERAEARILSMQSVAPRRSRYQDFVDDGETPYEAAA